MCAHEAEADEGVVGRNGRRDNRVDKHALAKEVACDGECQIGVTDLGRDGRCGGMCCIGGP